MKKILCKEDFHFFSGLYFEKDKYYLMREDSSESCLVYNEDNEQPYFRFYYSDYFPVIESIPIFEKYFNNIREIRKNKLLKIYESTI